MRTAIIAVALALALLLAACTAQLPAGDAKGTAGIAMEEQGGAMTKDSKVADSITAKDEGVMMEKAEGAAMEEKSGGAMDSGFTGKVLAGTTTPYIEFNEEDYIKANEEGKTILLYFYASWCPTCRAEQPDIFSAFNQLNQENFVGFRVKYKDAESDAEKELARKFGVPYQHTKVIVKNFEQSLKSPESWDVARYLAEAAKYS